MRQIAGLMLALGAGMAFGQQAQPNGSASDQGIRPQAMVQIHRDSVGANIVRITVLDADYPPEQLKGQIEAIGKNLGVGPRGVQIVQNGADSNSKSGFLQATFAVNGLIDPGGGVLRIAPIVMAFAGVPPPHTIKAFNIDFDYELVTPDTLGDFDSSAVHVQRRVVDRSIEYSVTLGTQDPRGIDIPDGSTTKKAGENLSPRTESTDWIVIAAVALAAVAAGALVYCLLILRPANKRNRSA